MTATGVTVNVTAVELLVVMLTVPLVVLLMPAARVTGFAEALRILLPPPPPLPVPLKITLMGTAAKPLGLVGVRVTVAEAPVFNPAVVTTLKFKEVGVTVPPETASQFLFAEPEVSPV